MKPGFFEGVAVALIASLVAAILYTVSAPMFGNTAALRVIIGGLALSYVLYLLRRSPSRNGRLVGIVMWGFAAAILTYATNTLLAYTAGHLLLIWIVRSFNFYTSLLVAMLDLGLSVLSLLAAVWASLNTGSVAAAIWCTFLVQSLFVFLPRVGIRRSHPETSPPEDSFQRALRVAEDAVSKLSTAS
jgi:hypothetical protein